VRKLGVPGEEELAMGALACGGVRIFNEDLLARLGVPASAVDAVVAREQEELERRVRAYRGTRPPPLVAGRTVILADDGLATGVSMRAAAIALSSLSPDRIIVAVPVGAAEVCARLREVADEVLCAETPEPFLAVSNWYDDFSQTTDDEVRNLLEKARGDAPAGGEGATHLEKHAS
jgi:putative phosphoribosyl transferase